MAFPIFIAKILVFIDVDLMELFHLSINFLSDVSLNFHQNKY